MRAGSVPRRTALISAPKIRVDALMYRNTRVATTPAKLPYTRASLPAVRKV